MLSSQEQQVWDDVQRFWAEEAEEPPLLVPEPARGRWRRTTDDLPVPVVAGIWISDRPLVLFGVAGPSGGPVATASAWPPRPTGAGGSGTSGRGRAPGRPTEG